MEESGQTAPKVDICDPHARITDHPTFQIVLTSIAVEAEITGICDNVRGVLASGFHRPDSRRWRQGEGHAGYARTLDGTTAMRCLR